MNRNKPVDNADLLETLPTAITSGKPPTITQYRALESFANRHFVRTVLRERLLAREIQQLRTLTADLRALNDIAFRKAALD